MLLKLGCILLAAFMSMSATSAVGSDSEFDLVIYGGSSAGIAAAVQAKRMGLKDVVVLEPTGRIGGLTTGGLVMPGVGGMVIMVR